MKVISLVTLGALLFGCFSAVADASDPVATSPTTSETLPSASAQADYDLIPQGTRGNAHPGLYRYSTKAQIDAMFDSERAKLNQPVTKLAFREIVAQTLAGIRCGHTSLEGDTEMDAAMKAAPTLPLRVLTEGNHVHVLLNDTADDQAIQPGMEVVEIDGHPVRDMLPRFYAVTSGDGDILSGEESRFEQSIRPVLLGG